MGGHVKTVFYLMAVIFACSVLLTVTTFSEVPLNILRQIQMNNRLVRNLVTPSYLSPKLDYTKVSKFTRHWIS